MRGQWIWSAIAGAYAAGIGTAALGVDGLPAPGGIIIGLLLVNCGILVASLAQAAGRADREGE